MAESVAVPGSAAASRALAFAVVPVAVFGVLLAEAHALPTAWLPLDEAAGVERARGLSGAITGPLYPLLLAPLARHASAHALLAGARSFDVLVWTAVLAPAYALARRLVSSRLAAAAAVLSVLIPGAVYAGALVPEPLAMLLGAGALALEVRASERGSLRLLAAALACGTAAAFTRPWLAALPPALAAAYVLPRLRGRRLSWFWGAVGVAALYGLYYGLGSASPGLARAVGHPWTVLRDGLGSAGVAALGFGLLPAVLAATRLSWHPAGVLLTVAAPSLAFAAGLSAAGMEGGADERPLLVLAPLVFALAAEGWAAGRPAGRRVVPAAAGVAVLLAAIPWPAAKPTLADAPGLEFVRSLLGGTGVAPFVLAVSALAAAALLLRPLGLTVRLALAAVLLALIPGGELVAWNQARRAADSLDAALPRPRDWVDRAVGTKVAVAVVAAPNAFSPQALAELRLWNRSLGSLVPVDPAQANAQTGELPVAVTPARALAVGIELAGRPLAHGPSGTVYEPGPPLRLAASVQGLYPDGWSGSDVAYRRFAGIGAASVRVTISRTAWGGPDVPGDVRVISSPIGGRVTARRDTVVHAGKAVAVEIPVPAPPFEVDIHVDTFSPARFGQHDTRRLGAQVGFRYPG